MKKNLVTLAVASALAAGTGIVHAQALPSTDASDLWLFVADTAAQTSFEVDTGISISSLLPSSDYTTTAEGNTLTIDDSASYTASSALSAYISAAEAAGQGSDLEWAVEGVNYNLSPSNTGYKKAGGIVALASGNTIANAGAGFESAVLPNVQTWANGFESDIAVIDNVGYAAGGSSYAWSNGNFSSGGSVWGSTDYAPGGSTDEYYGGAQQAGVSLTGSQQLYAVTGAGTSGEVESYLLGTVTLSANGSLTLGSGTTPPPSTVPLPAPLWLLGSGLLGLAGVGRRRAV